MLILYFFLLQTLHLYVEAVTDVVMAKLVYCGQVVQRVQETISSLGISGNCRIIVEEADIEVYFLLYFKFYAILILKN